MKKLACLFPGIGYTCDKPLLYYSWKLLSGQGWEVVPVRYGGFESGVKGNPEKMQRCADQALEQAEAILGAIDWAKYDEILMIGKSIGTVVGCAYACRHRITCRQILYTPVEETFRFVSGISIAFHGTKDPWADTETIERCCLEKGIPLHETRGANHSLETGDVDRDIETVRDVMRIVGEFAGYRLRTSIPPSAQLSPGARQR